MKIGYNQATAMGCSSLEQDLALCEAAGFDYIEIRFDMLREYLKTHTMEDLKAFFTGSRLRPHALNAVYLFRELFSDGVDTETQSSFLEDFQWALSVAKELNAGYLVVVPPMGPGAYSEAYPGEWGQALEDCVRILKRLCAAAAQYGIRLGLEPVGAPRCSVRTMEQANEIIAAVNAENLGFVVDSVNLYMYHKLKDFGAIAAVAPEKIYVVHINDFDDVPETEFALDKRCFCGDGVIDLANYLSAVKRSGYTGMVSVETFRPQHWAKEPQWVVAAAYETTRRCLAENGCI